MLEYREPLHNLYYGTSKKSAYFRFGLIAFDLITISFFIVTSMVELSAWIITIDFMIAFVLSLDFLPDSLLQIIDSISLFSLSPF